MNDELLGQLIHDAIVSGDLTAQSEGYTLVIKNRHIIVYDEDDYVVYEEPIDSDDLGDCPDEMLARAGFAPVLTLESPINTFREDVEDAILDSVTTVLDIVINTPDGRLFWTATVSAIPDDDFGATITVTNNDTGGILYSWTFTPDDTLPKIWWQNAKYNAGMLEW